MQISGGESKAKAHMLTFLKKSPDFKTAYLRNDKYCTTRGGVHIPELNNSVSDLQNAIAHVIPKCLCLSSILPLQVL